MDRLHLYEEAFRFRKKKLWEKLTEDMIFAVRLEPDLMGYVSIMGMLGEHFALGLYPGREGFTSYIRLHNTDPLEVGETEYRNRLVSQRNLQCSYEMKDFLDQEGIEEVRSCAKRLGIRLSGKNSYPVFMKMTPGRVPHPFLEEKEEEYLSIALEAASWAADHSETVLPLLRHVEEDKGSVCLLEKKGGDFRIGKAALPEVEQEEGYPEGGVCNDISKAKIRRLKKRGTWCCMLVRLLEPMPWSGDTVPVYPMNLLTVDTEEGELVEVQPTADYETRTDVMLNVFMDAILRRGYCPEEIEVTDDRTEALLRKWCADTKIRLSRVEKCPELEDAYDYLYSGAGDIPEEEIFRMLDMIMDMSDEELLEMPEEMGEEIHRIAEMAMDIDEVPDEMRTKLTAFSERLRSLSGKYPSIRFLKNRNDPDRKG